MASSSSSSSSHHHRPAAFAKVLKAREKLESRRTKQLHRIAKLLDDIAKEEMEAVRASFESQGSDTAAEQGAIEVQFLDPQTDEKNK